MELGRREPESRDQPGDILRTGRSIGRQAQSPQCLGLGQQELFQVTTHKRVAEDSRFCSLDSSGCMELGGGLDWLTTAMPTA